jgi:hypothetical protein
MNQQCFIGIFLALAACSGRPEPASRRIAADSATTELSIFREIDIRPFGKITLGAPFTRRSPSVVAVGPRLFALNAAGGHFANTDSILVRVDDGSLVRAVYFVYLPGTDFSAGIADYQSSLGPPTAQGVNDSAGGKLERTVWEDRRTHFEMTRFSVPGMRPRVASAMIDRSTPQ